MEFNNITYDEIFSNNESNNCNYNNVPFVHLPNKLTKKINIYPSPIIRHRSPMNLGLNIGNNNVPLKNSKKFLKNKPILDFNNISNDQNINILNLDLFPRNTNPNMINFNKNIPNDNQNKQKYFKENLTENNSLVNNTINEFKEKKDIKERKANYQYIMKKVKKVNQPLISGKKQFNDLTKNSTKKEGIININKIREELISIHDNRKYNYDKKVQKINVKKIIIPQSKKLVERILKKSEEKKEQNRNIELQKYSNFKEQKLDEFKDSSEQNNKEQIININKNIQNDNTKKIIQNFNSDNNSNQLPSKDFQPKNNQSMNINNSPKNCLNYINNEQIQSQKQIENLNKKINSNNQNQTQNQNANKQMKQFHNILLPPPTNNNNISKNIIIPSNQQIINAGSHQTITFIQKLSPIIHIDYNSLKASPLNNEPNFNIDNNLINKQINIQINNNISSKQDKESNFIYSKNVSNISNNNNFDEPKNSDEFDSNENSNIQFQKSFPKINDLRNISQMEQPIRNLVPNNKIIHPDLNINMEQIQNIANIKPIKINESKIFRYPQQNMNFSESINYFDQYNKNSNFQQCNNKNINIINSNSHIMNNNFEQNININANENFYQKLNHNNINLNVSDINNNITQNFDDQDFASVEKLEEIPNNTIIGNATIKNGNPYYANQNIQYINNQQSKISNNQMLNMNNYNLTTNININGNNINNNQTINNQIINKAQNSFITRIPNSPQNQVPIKPQNNSQTQTKNVKNVIKKKKISRVAKLLQEKEPKEKKKALQYQIERNRPVFAVPQSKKRAVSQGKPLTWINKYYDENYILEDDKEEDEKNEEINNLHIEKNKSDDKETSSN